MAMCMVWIMGLQLPPVFAFGDKGYISKQLFDLLYGQGIQLITKLKKNMKNKLMPLFDKLMLRKRAIIETIIDQLKNISQIEHTRHRGPINLGDILNAKD